MLTKCDDLKEEEERDCSVHINTFVAHIASIIVKSTACFIFCLLKELNICIFQIKITALLQRIYSISGKNIN